MTTPQQPKYPIQYDARQQMPLHGQEYDGYRYDANTGQWALIDPNEIIAGKQESPSKRMLVGFGLAVVGALVVGIGIANWAADDAPAPVTTTISAPVSKDQQFLDALATEINVYPHTTDANLVRSATLICNGFDDGLSYDGMAREIYMGNDVTLDQAEQWIDIAARIFCPGR